MKELIERWRGEFSNNTAPECADELQAWLDSLWTKVDPKKRRTWAKGDCVVSMNIAGFWTTPRPKSSCSDELDAAVDGVDVRWRPIIHGIDTP